MKTLNHLTVLAFALLLSACAGTRELQPHDWAMEVQNADTRKAHLLLADHYEDIAKAMVADAEEERRMLANYHADPHKYGKRILDLKARADAMIIDFERAATESRAMAEYHRQFARDLP